jgi:hypothetical protein
MPQYTVTMTKSPSPVIKSVSTVFTELVDGSASNVAWVLNRDDDGLLKSLDRLSSREASEVAPGGGATIAAHVDHLCYGLSLLNRWSAGEEDPFADADYSASWRRTTVSDAEWASLRGRLKDEAHRWRDALETLGELDEIALNGVIASAAHLAYHVGAIRQINRSTRGPSAND